jgi:acetoacetyl-CoA synthetase
MRKEKTKKLWEPSQIRVQNSHMTLFTEFVSKKLDRHFQDWAKLHHWSLECPHSFWGLASEYLGIKWQERARQIYSPPKKGKIQGATWFQGGYLNYAQNILASLFPEGEVLLEYEESKKISSRTAQELWNRVAQLATGLKKLGLKKGDSVTGVLSNTIESVEAMLAVTSLGGIWSSCSPDFGLAAISQRLLASCPRFVFYCETYSYKGKSFNCGSQLELSLELLPSVEKIILVSSTEKQRPPLLEGKILYEELIFSNPLAIDPNTGLFPIDFELLSFSDPLYIMFSSGTTGAPKCIVHGIGGTLLQHKKELMLHSDLKAGEGFCFYTNTSWMMWNWMISALSVGARVVLYNGAPSYPEPLTLWEIAKKEQVAILGTSPTYLTHSKKFMEDTSFKEDFLPHLKTLLTTGSPLLPEHFRWVYSKVKKDIHLASISGGTDILSCFVLGNPNLPVYEGEIQVAGLGMAVVAKKQERMGSCEEKAELVCTKPFVSMPLYFLNDPYGKKLTETYFSFYSDSQDEVWRHGDYIEETLHGGYIIHGRSDATLNPNGIRMGTSEFYNALEGLKEVEDALVVAQKKQEGDKILLFVVLASGVLLNKILEEKIIKKLETDLTKRHRPQKIFQVKEIPYTHSGKKLEILVSHLINGEPIENLNAVKNQESLRDFEECKVFLEKWT